LSGGRARALFNPFPGLRPFEPDEDHLFFGREKELDELLRRLRSCHLLSVVGTSGSGKSSLVRSGLIPALHSGFMVNAGSSWRVSTVRPGEDPIGYLAAGLNEPDVLGTVGELASTNRVLLEATLRRSTLGLVNAVRQAKISPRDNVLVVIDQFEELFRFQRSRQIENSRDEAVAFVKLLLEATQQDDVPIYVVLTIRSDFIGDCMDFPGLPEAINAGQYLVPRMTRDELRTAITGPVAVGGGEIAPRLVLRLLNDLAGDHDQLPLLQHALMRTWDYWERHRQQGEAIDVSDYEAVGTLRQALSLHAEEAYQETGSERSQHLTQRIFKALTDTFSDQRGVRRATTVQELAAICEAPEQEVIQIVEVFRRPGRCFLMPPATVRLDSRSIIDLSHESLMRCWTRLIAWAEEERVSTGVYARLSQAACWCEEGTAGLWRNPELELGLRWKRQNRPTQAWAERYNSFFVLAMEFLDRSEKERDRIEAEREEERKKKLRHAQQVAGVLGSLFVLALFLAYVAWNEKRRAEGNLELARRAVDESLSSAGRQPAREAADVPQLEEFRQELLQKAEEFYSNYLAKEENNNEALRYEAALAHSKLGDISRLLERHEEAVKQYKDAIDRLEKLSKEYPAKPAYRQALAYAHNWLGETLRIWLEKAQPPQYTRPDAEKEYDSALDVQQGLSGENPENGQYQQELARTYYNRGILRYDSGHPQDSESDFHQAIGLLDPLAAKKTQSWAESTTNPSQDLARVYNDLGTLLRREGRQSEAQEFYKRAIGIHEQLKKNAPDNREYQVELATFHSNLASLLWDQRELDLAEQENHRALDLIEELARPAPSLESERAKAHMLRGLLPKSQHPEFHVMYAQLGDQYVEFAKNGLEAGSTEFAQAALESLAHVIPEVGEPDRTRFAKAYLELQRELRDKMANRR
jgi:tetratricopeptide (TPR) repeat protein